MAVILCLLVLFYFRSYLSLAGAVHHGRRPQDTAVILVQEAVFRSLEVFQHKHILELAILAITKISDIVSLDTGGVYILMGQRKIHNLNKNDNENENINKHHCDPHFLKCKEISALVKGISKMFKCSDTGRFCGFKKQVSRAVHTGQLDTTILKKRMQEIQFSTSHGVLHK